MNQDPYKYLKFRKEGKEVKHVDPEIWFHKWLRIMLITMALGFTAIAFSELLLRWIT